MSIIENLSEFSLVELLKALVNAQYYEYFFPFLLLFALYYQVIHRVLGKKGKNLFTKPAALIISLVVSFYSISFKFSTGYSIADFMIMLFPNISAISMAILSMYIIGSILGFDFFKNLFRKDLNAYSIFFFGIIAFGSVVYYSGIVIGLWGFDPYDKTAWFSTVFAIALLILSVVFFIIGWIALAFGLLYVSTSFIFNSGTTSIFDLLFDPILFIGFIVIFFMTWLSKNDGDEKKDLELAISQNRQTINDIESRYGRKPNQGEDLLYDINTQALETNEKKYNQLYSN